MSRTPRILIVEDDRDIRGLLARSLVKAGFRTCAAPDGRAELGLAIAQNIILSPGRRHPP